MNTNEIPELTSRQREALQLINDWRAGLPTPSRLAEALGLASESGVRVLLTPLEKKGLIERLNMGVGLPRPPRVTKLGKIALGLRPVAVPMYPHAHAGSAATQLDEPAEWISDLSDLFPLANGEYFLPVKGDCMTGGEEPIFEGDIVLCQPRSRLCRPMNGAATHIELPLDTGENEPLVREYWFYPARGIVVLKPRNPTHDEIVLLDEEVDPRGVVVSVIHQPRRGKK